MTTRDLIREEWETTSHDAKYLAYKYSLTEQSVRTMVTGLKGPKKEKRSLSAFHRALGMKLIDKRLQSRLTKQDFGRAIGVSHFRLGDLERGYDELTVSEIVNAELTEEFAALDPTLLENE